MGWQVAVNQTVPVVGLGLLLLLTLWDVRTHTARRGGLGRGQAGAGDRGDVRKGGVARIREKGL